MFKFILSSELIKILQFQWYYAILLLIVVLSIRSIKILFLILN